MIGRVCLLLYDAVCWRAGRLPRERANLLRARWAMRFHALTTGGLDDGFAAELFGLVRETPGLLDQLERETAGSGRAARQRLHLLSVLRQALARGAVGLD